VGFNLVRPQRLLVTDRVEQPGNKKPKIEVTKNKSP
jgi:hypothetical protein